MVGECVVSCARGQLSFSRCSCSSFSVLVEERSSIAWKTKTLCCRRLLGRRRLCALVDCLEDEDCLSAVGDCLEDKNFVLSSIAWKTRIVCRRRLLGTWIEDVPRDRASVLSSIAWNVEDDCEIQCAVVEWLGDVRTVAQSYVLAVVGIVDDERIVASLQSGKRCVLCVCRSSVVSRLWQAVDDELTQ